ncbi:MAG: hypothetical protein K9M07_03335 [Simkaniaceae bacterium]|nr:hypothetical protein [Simkaniaceae bacterium]MCF7852257.1 hypothetical protein [Simkaniaceae bacterium]
MTPVTSGQLNPNEYDIGDRIAPLSFMSLVGFSLLLYSSQTHNTLQGRVAFLAGVSSIGYVVRELVLNLLLPSETQKSPARAKFPPLPAAPKQPSAPRFPHNEPNPSDQSSLMSGAAGLISALHHSLSPQEPLSTVLRDDSGDPLRPLSPLFSRQKRMGPEELASLIERDHSGGGKRAKSPPRVGDAAAASVPTRILSLPLGTERDSPEWLDTSVGGGKRAESPPRVDAAASFSSPPLPAHRMRQRRIRPETMASFVGIDHSSGGKRAESPPRIDAAASFSSPPPRIRCRSPERASDLDASTVGEKRSESPARVEDKEKKESLSSWIGSFFSNNSHS